MADHQVASWVTPKEGIRNPEDFTVGSLARQDADAVAITGGSITGTTVAESPVVTGATAAGSAQGDALAITAGVTVFATVGSGTGARLPAGVVGIPAFIFNGGANALLVYPATGGQIDALGANAGFSVAAGKGALLMGVSASQWHSVKGA